MTTYFRTPTLLPGRSLFALQQVQKRLPADADPRLAASVDAALTIVRAQWDAERRWARSRTRSTARGNAKLIDQQTDAVLANLAGVCTGLARLGEGHPLGDAATAFMARFFPDGVSVVMRATYEDELLLVELLLEAVNEAPAADWGAALPIDGLIEQLRDLAPQYRAELEAQSDAITWSEVRQTVVASRDALETVISGLRFIVEDGAERAALLAPIDAQVERQRAKRVRNKDTVDVDPQTGEEVPIGDALEG